MWEYVLPSVSAAAFVKSAWNAKALQPSAQLALQTYHQVISVIYSASQGWCSVRNADLLPGCRISAVMVIMCTIHSSLTLRADCCKQQPICSIHMSVLRLGTSCRCVPAFHTAALLVSATFGSQ